MVKYEGSNQLQYMRQTRIANKISFLWELVLESERYERLGLHLLLPQDEKGIRSGRK